MKLIKVAAAVLNQTPLDWQTNRDNIEGAIDAAKAGVLLCLPELCITGYGCEDAFHSPGTAKMAEQILDQLLPATKGLAVSLGLPVRHQNALFNVACLVVDGAICGFVGKQFLAGDGLHYEPRWFKPWPKGVRSEVELGGKKYPIGDIHFNCGGVKIGFEICEDAWVANRPGTQLALKGMDVILNPSASHFAFGKLDVRKRFVLEGSRAFGVSYVYANLLGNEAGRAIYDGGALIASAGKLVAAGPRFSFADWLVTSAVIDVEATRMNQARTGSYMPGLEQASADCIAVSFPWRDAEPTRTAIGGPAWENVPEIKEEEFTRTITLALYDYLRKSRAGGLVVSLSGGADSSAVASLAALMVELAIGEIGVPGFLRKLPAIKKIQNLASIPDLIHGLLTCVYQSTRNSTATTRSAARVVANALNARFYELDVDDLVNGYIEKVAQAVGRQLTWKQDDLALQNIQARVRSPGVWLIANLENALLLSTSNRSEAAVGYATMDGDTSGGLCPIAGIDKAFLIRWLLWLEQKGPVGLHPIPELSVVTSQPPTAELRPSEDHQTDEEDLMPYVVLDAIERAAIRDKLTPVETFQVIRAQFTSHEVSKLGFWVERFFRLWCRNQWKRERYAPSFHVDDENLDPKTWCRFPILSGGFAMEIEELREYLKKSALK